MDWQHGVDETTLHLGRKAGVSVSLPTLGPTRACRNRPFWRKTIHPPSFGEGRTEPRGGLLVTLNVSAPLAQPAIASMPVTNFDITSRRRSHTSGPWSVIRPSWMTPINP